MASIGSNGPASQALTPTTGAYFLVEITGVPLGQFATCSGLRVEVETMEYAEGGNNSFVHVLPTRRRYPPLELSRGLTDQAALLQWFVSIYENNQAATDITVSLMQQSGQPVTKWAAAGAYPTRWAGPELNAGMSQVAMERLTIVHQGLKVV